MKKVIPFMLLMMMLALVACGAEAKNPKVSDVMAKIREEINFPEMAEKTPEELAGYGYDELSPEDIEESAFIIATSGVTAEEVFFVKLKEDSEVKTSDVTKMMETRRDQIAATAQDYTPEEMEKINGALIGEKGRYAYFAITGDNAKAKEIIKNAF